MTHSIYKLSTDPSRPWKGLVIRPELPKNLRGGVLMPAEGGNWWVSLSGAGKDYPPTDEENFLAFAKTLSVPTLYDAIKDAEPVSPIYGYRRTENRLRHFDRLQHHPEGFVVMGDAFCHFNPIYGQGMTVAAMQAMILRQSLEEDLPGLPLRIYKDLVKIITLPWQMASSNDYRVPSVEGEEIDEATRLMHRYFDGVTKLLPSSPPFALTFAEVIQMLKPSTVLFHPSVILQVAQEDGDMDMIRVAFRIANQAYPDLDMTPYLAELNKLVHIGNA